MNGNWEWEVQYCSREYLKEFKDTLEEWSEVKKISYRQVLTDFADTYLFGDLEYTVMYNRSMKIDLIAYCNHKTKDYKLYVLKEEN